VTRGVSGGGDLYRTIDLSESRQVKAATPAPDLSDQVGDVRHTRATLAPLAT